MFICREENFEPDEFQDEGNDLGDGQEYTNSDKNKAKKLVEDVKAYDPQAEEYEKRKQMAEIYGEDNWEKVLSAETSLHLNFNRYCDKELPQKWPCIPLNLKFN